jgi:peptide/nickel transport system ATP-binding protein
MNGSHLLNVERLGVSYPHGSEWVAALHGVSLSIDRGEKVAVVGQSGSGKTTLAQSIIGLISGRGRIDTGRIVFDGMDLTSQTPAALRAVRGAEIGLVPQDPMMSLNPLKKIGSQVGEALRIHKKITKREAAARSVELLRRAGIRSPEMTASHYPHQLSGGMRQRALIAAAIACDPQLIIADEPTSALDVTVQKLILDQIDELAERTGVAVLLITHDLAVASDRADRIVVMKDGRIVETGTTGAVMGAPRSPYTKHLMASAPSMTSPRPVTTASVADRSSPADEPMLEVAHLTKSFRVAGGSRFTAVDDVSFEVARGTTLGVVGESGSGKSTVARCVMRLEDVDEGTIRLDDLELTALRRHQLRALRPRFQMVYQNPYGSLNPRMAVEQLVVEPIALHGLAPRSQWRDRVAELLEQVALSRTLMRRKPSQLSGGQRQRVAIARALAAAPDLIVLDEPVSALDVSVQRQVLDLLVRLQAEQQLTYVFVSHDLAVVRQIASDVVVMERGKIVDRGVPDRLFSRPTEPYTQRLVNAIPGKTSLLASTQRVVTNGLNPIGEDQTALPTAGSTHSAHEMTT